MFLNFIGEIKELSEGIEILSNDYNFSRSGDGIPVYVECRPGNLEVVMEKGQGKIYYQEKIHFFRGLGLMLEQFMDTDSFSIIEEPQFTMNGPMFDMSKNAVLKVESIKKILRMLSIMGLNTLMLSTDNTYEIKGMPYFGYMQGKYTFDELKECDDYAYTLGIEIVPCIQTLAKLKEALKWIPFEDMQDTDDIILVGFEESYIFIEEMIKSITAPLRSRRIHLGMDEAQFLGLGRYMDFNGYRKSFDIFCEHINRVLEITDRYGLKPMIWSDMFFRLHSKHRWYYDAEPISEETISKIPKKVQLIYWDYHHDDIEFYLNYIRRHKAISANPVFSGGVQIWSGFSTYYSSGFTKTMAALKACKEEGIKEVFISLWGDNGSENNFFAAILMFQLYAEHGYAKEPDMVNLKNRFKFCTKGEYELFMALEDLDIIKRTEGTFAGGNPCKYLLWQDLLIGLFDRHAQELDLSSYYLNLADKYNNAISVNPEWKIIFNVVKKLAEVLSLKSNMGVRIKQKYDNKDIPGLTHIYMKELPELYIKVEELRLAHRDQWFSVYKPFGWEVLDIRYGGLLARIRSAEDRIQDFVNEKISKIDELEETRLWFDGISENRNSPLTNCNAYHRIVTAGKLSS